MNRILQKFVGDTSSSASASSKSRTPASTGNMSSNGSNWASVGYHSQGYANQSQQQYYGQQQPASDGGGYGYHTQQQYHNQQLQQGYVATNSQGQYLDEIPLSSPQANSKPDAATLFDDVHYPQQQQQQQQSYYNYDSYGAQQQQYPGAHDQQQYPVATESFFQSSQPITSSVNAPPRSTSGSPNPFAQPPHSSTSSRSGSGGFGHFQESAADPFASNASMSFTTSVSSNSLTGFEQQQSPFQTQQQEPVSLSRSTSATASDLFANAPPSTTPSYDGFDHHQQVAYSGESNAAIATLETSGSAADPFATSASAAIPSFYDGFAQQSDNVGWDSSALTAAPADLFASAGPAAVASSSSPFDSFGHQQQHQYAQADYYAPSSESASAFGDSSIADPFAIPPQSSHSNGLSQQTDSGVDNVDPFASSSHSFANSNNSFEQHFEQSPQQHQYYYSNQELGPFGNSTGAVSSEYPQQHYQHHADPFVTQQPESEYASHTQSEQVDPFAQPQPVAAFGYQVQEQPPAAAAPPASLSPTQVNDFFSDAPPSATSLFSSQSVETTSKSPPPSLFPKKPAAVALEPNDLGFSPRKPISSCEESSFESKAIPAATPMQKQEERDPVAADDEEEADEAISLQLKKTTLDDSHTLVEMYKHMAERLEGEKNELLKVLADQADQFYQMQEYIASLEQELAAHRSNGGTRAAQ